MVTQRFWLVLLFVLHPADAVSIGDTIVYREAVVPGTREFVSLGGLFPIRRRSEGQCGALRDAGVERAEAMVYAIRTINANTSILPGVNLTFDIRDTCAISNIALERSIEYVQSSDTVCANQTTLAISGALGAARSSVSASVAGLFRLFQIPQISYASTAALLSDKSMFDYFFRTVPSDVFQARAMADLIVHFNWTYIFALHSEDTYGREGIESLLTEINLKNDTRTCVALREALPLSSGEEFYDDVVERMSQEWVRNASVAVLFGHTEEATGMLRAVTRSRATNIQDITWIASDSWAVSLPEEYHEIARGMLGVLPPPGNVEGFRSYFVGLNPEKNNTANPWFEEYWERVFNCSLDGNEPCQTSNQNISIVDIDPQISNVIDAVYAFAHALHQMIVDHCPNETVCDAITTRRLIGEAIDGTLLRQYLFNVSFPSTYSEGRLFDGNGDVQGSYLITNLQLTTENQSFFETVATWDHINLLQLTAPIEWISGGVEAPQSVCSLPCGAGFQQQLLPDQAQCCWKCKACLGENSASSGEECYECAAKHMPNPERSGCVEIPVTYFTWSNPFAIFILILTGMGIAITTFVAVMFAVFHKNKVIKAASRELIAILLSGIFLCYVLPFFFIAKPSPALCGVRRFAIGFCFAISYSALLVRSNRIHRIFNRSPGKVVTPPRFIGGTSQVLITCLLICIQVLIGVVWLAVEHPSVEEDQVDSRTVELRCRESRYIGLPISLGYNLLLLVLSTYFAFLTRKVPDNFNEAKFINVTVYSLCIIWLGFVPAYFISIRFGTEYSNFFLLLGVILSASTTLLCLLVPKIFVVLFVDKIKPLSDKSPKVTDNTEF